MVSKIFASTLALAGSAVAVPFDFSFLGSRAAAAQVNTQAVTIGYRFPAGTQRLENLVVTSETQILVTSATSPHVYAFNPANPNATPPTVVQGSTSDATGYTGITQLSSGNFAFIGAIVNTSGPTGPTESNVAIYNFSAPLTGAGSSGTPITPKLVAKIPSAKFGNGLISLPGTPGTVLMADSVSGTIVKINTITGANSVVISNAALQPTAQISLGVNGIRILNNYLYYTNSAKNTTGRVAINSDGTVASGASFQTLATTPQSGDEYDDLCFSADGSTAYVTTHDNTLAAVTISGSNTGAQSIYVGGGQSGVFSNSSLGPSACMFGAGKYASNIYVTCSDGYIAIVNTTQISSGPTGYGR